jgi:hypothetical protein
MQQVLEVNSFFFLEVNSFLFGKEISALEYLYNYIRPHIWVLQQVCLQHLLKTNRYLNIF